MGHKLLFAASLLTACAATAPNSTEPPAGETDFTFRGHISDPTVTHVVAISETDSVVSRVVARVHHGALALTVPIGRPWLVVFVDDTQIGAAKTVGVLRAGTIDALLAAAPGEVELGAVHFAAGSAFAALDDASLQAALGLDDTVAATLGAMDDFATRYANVDLDDDGVLDAYQPGFAARLDMHAKLRLTAHGRTPSLQDLIAGDFDLTYLGAAITARMPDSFGAFELDRASATFDAPFYGLISGASTPVVLPGTPVTGADLVAGTDHNFGVYGRPDHLLPGGDYRFAVPGGKLEFTDVRASTYTIIAPFIRLEMATGCAQTGCVPESLHFAWMRQLESGWTPVTDAEVAVLQPTASVQIVQTGATGVTYRGYALPPGIATGWMPWSDNGTLYTTATAPQPAADLQFMAVRFGIGLGITSDASFAVTPLQAAPLPAR